MANGLTLHRREALWKPFPKTIDISSDLLILFTEELRRTGKKPAEESGRAFGRLQIDFRHIPDAEV
jgi:hypothetical protein